MAFQGDDRSVAASWRAAGHDDAWTAEQLGCTLADVQSVRPRDWQVPTPDEIRERANAIRNGWTHRESERRRTGLNADERRVHVSLVRLAELE